MTASVARATSIDPVLAAILLASLVLKLLLAFWAEPLDPRNDEHTYVVMARSVEEGRLPGGLRPPGYPVFLAGIAWLGGDLGTARIVQGCLSVISTLFVYALGQGVGGRPAARLAAGLFAFDPVLISFSHLLWSETLYVFLWLAALCVLLPRFDTNLRWRWTVSGLIFGLSAWVRPQILSFLPFLLLWTLWRSQAATLRSAVVAAALLVAACAVVVVPRTAYVLAERGKLMVISTTGAFNLLVGTDPSAAFIDKDDHWKSTWGQLPGGGYQQDAALKIGWLRIVSHPGLFVHKAAWEIAHLWTLDSFLLRHLRNGWYGELPGGVLPTAVMATATFSALLIAAGLLGMLLQPQSPFRAVTGLALLHSVLLFGATFSLSRYGVPLRPLLAVGAAWILSHRHALRRSRLDRRRWTLIALGAGLLACSWASDAPLLWDMLSNGGREFRFRWLD